VLEAEVVELYRALRTRDRVHGAYARALDAARREGVLSASDLRTLNAVLEDEGQTDEHADHLDLRLQVFASRGWSRDIRLPEDGELERINAAWLAIAEEANAFELIAIHAAIEAWYVPIAGFFEAQYLGRGFTPFEVETYAIHKDADQWHSSAAFVVLGKHAGAFDLDGIVGAVRRTFRTVRAYDQAKLVRAEARRSVTLG